MSKVNVYLASKPRYEILDGLRGVAALMVIIFHCLETYIPVFGTQIVNHGYLAVDFFFAMQTPGWKFALCLVMGLLMIPCIGGKTGIPDGIHQAVCILLIFPLIVLAWGVLKVYDEPVRNWLKEHWLKK